MTNSNTTTEKEWWNETPYHDGYTRCPDCGVEGHDIPAIIAEAERRERDRIVGIVKMRLETFWWDGDLGDDLVSNVMENRRKLNNEILSRLTPNE